MKTAAIHLVRGTNAEGVDFFAYVTGHENKIKALKLALRGGQQPNLDKSGVVVLYLGRGAPDEKLTQRILANFS